VKHLSWSLVASCATARVLGCDLDCLLERELREQGLAGAVYSIVEGEQTRVGAVGLANHDARKPMRAESRVHVGSVAKTLLALGVLRLATQGRLELDDPVAKLLPQVALENPWRGVIDMGPRAFATPATSSASALRCVSTRNNARRSSYRSTATAKLRGTRGSTS
jgi:CubicO group peptidase (beta-lactamase class C family)